MEWDLKAAGHDYPTTGDNRKAGYTADDIVASFQNNTEGQSAFQLHARHHSPSQTDGARYARLKIIPVL